MLNIYKRDKSITRDVDEKVLILMRELLPLKLYKMT